MAGCMFMYIGTALIAWIFATSWMGVGYFCYATSGMDCHDVFDLGERLERHLSVKNECSAGDGMSLCWIDERSLVDERRLRSNDPSQRVNGRTVRQLQQRNRRTQLADHPVAQFDRNQRVQPVRQQRLVGFDGLQRRHGDLRDFADKGFAHDLTSLRGGRDLPEELL